MENTGGLDDNGSGVAAMMELARARALSHGECSPKHSIILVAFDLEEYGSQGSLIFVQDFLIPKIARFRRIPKVQGNHGLHPAPQHD